MGGQQNLVYSRSERVKSYLKIHVSLYSGKFTFGNYNETT